ncbi:MAG: glycosyltransferase family 25 protein [Chitinophagaceae bacterium]
MNSSLSILNTFFDKIYVVTLTRATNRQTKIKEILKDVDYEFFYGVDKMNLDIDVLKKENIYNEEQAIKLHKNSKPMFLGQVACSLSHRKLYEKILAEGYEKVLIFEDDFIVDENAVKTIANAFQQLPPSWDLWYLGYYLNEETTRKMKLKQFFYLLLSYIKLIKFSPLQVKNLYAKPFSKNLMKAGFHNTTHSYAVNKKALQKLINAQTPVVFPADTLLSNLIISEKIEAYISTPKIFLQEIFLENGSKESFVSE